MLFPKNSERIKENTFDKILAVNHRNVGLRCTYKVGIFSGKIAKSKRTCELGLYGNRKGCNYTSKNYE
jgi:hypothetical protein